MRTFQDWVELLSDTSGKHWPEAVEQVQSALSSPNEALRSRAGHFLLSRLTQEWPARSLSLSLMQRSWRVPTAADGKSAVESVLRLVATVPSHAPEFAAAVLLLVEVCRQWPSLTLQLARAASSPSTEVQVASMLAAAKLEGVGPSVVPQLAARLHADAEGAYTAALLDGLTAHVATHAALLAPALFSAFERSDGQTRWRAASLLRSALELLALTDTAIPGGLESLETEALKSATDSNLAMRYQALALLGFAGAVSGPAVEVLEKGLEEGDPSVVAVSAAALLRRDAASGPATAALTRLAQTQDGRGPHEVTIAVRSLPPRAFAHVKGLLVELAQTEGPVKADAAALLALRG